MKNESLLPTQTPRPARTGLCLNRIFHGMEPSVRVPVTAENRQYLRALRQAELDAWRDAPGGTHCIHRREETQ